MAGAPGGADRDGVGITYAVTAIDVVAARAAHMAGSRKMSHTLASGQSTKAATKPRYTGERNTGATWMKAAVSDRSITIVDNSITID